MNQIYLLDTDFLRKLDLIQHKKVFAKITLLTWDEVPVKEIQGSITSGSINIDGASAVRRSCSLSMVTNNRDISKTYWTLNSKFKLEIGLENNIESKYPNIVWFKQGIYVFTSINMSVSTNNYTINLSGKDKMCLLNGEIGGTIAVSTDFGKIDETKTLETGEIIVETKSLKIVDIIKNMVNVYAEESWHNIIINNVDEYGFELLEWRSEQPLYMERDTNGNVTQAYVQWQERWGNQDNWKKQKQADDANDTKYFYSLSPLVDNSDATIIIGETNNYYLIKIEYGETVGYRITDLTYPGDLIANVGESITSVLDKIKNMFNDFEYFYNVDGQFVFQKKKTYANESYNNIIKQERQTYIEPMMYSSSSSYSFDNGKLITNFANTPNIANIKNDFSIWGTRKTASGAEVKIHLRKAIDTRPERYNTIGEWDKEKSEWKEETSKSFDISNGLDWREIIYQMALDYYKNNQNPDFNARISQLNQNGYYNKQTNMKFGLTGYEQYYADIQGFWRQLYHPGVFQEDFITESEKKQMARDWLYNEKGNEPTNEEVEAKLNDLEEIDELEEINGFQTILLETYQQDGWHKNVTEAPYLLNFWFDFIGERAELAEYSIDTIGHRTKAVSENAVAAIEYSQIPSAIFITAEERDGYSSGDYSGYTFIQITDQLKNFFTISSQGVSAQNKFESLLYNHIFVQESVTITALPIYYLQPNSRIHVSDKDTGIEGEYLVNKITIPLQYNGTTSITATKVVDKIY